MKTGRTSNIVVMMVESALIDLNNNQCTKKIWKLIQLFELVGMQFNV